MMILYLEINILRKYLKQNYIISLSLFFAEFQTPLSRGGEKVRHMSENKDLDVLRPNIVKPERENF
jgi:hypothetical protein